MNYPTENYRTDCGKIMTARKIMQNLLITYGYELEISKPVYDSANEFLDMIGISENRIKLRTYKPKSVENTRLMLAVLVYGKYISDQNHYFDEFVPIISANKIADHVENMKRHGLIIDGFYVNQIEYFAPDLSTVIEGEIRHRMNLTFEKVRTATSANIAKEKIPILE